MQKVSIIVPVYNVEKYLERCVKSIVVQTYSNIEIILVDDGSPDNSGKMCDNLKKIDERIKVIHKKNGGLSSARLAGFEESTGKYISFVDSDDYVEPDMIAELVQSIEKYNAEIAICAYHTVHDNNVTTSFLPYGRNVLQGRKIITKDYIIPLFGTGRKGEINIPGFTCIRLYHKALLKPEFFLSERDYFKEDHILNLLYSDCLHTVAIVNKPLYNYCVNSLSLSNCYRKNKWQMYSNLLSWYKSFIEKRKITGTEARLYNFVKSSIFATIDNAVNSGSYDSYKSEIEELYCNDSFTNCLSSLALSIYLDSQNISIVLLKLHFLHVLYKFRSKRINKTK